MRRSYVAVVNPTAGSVDAAVERALLRISERADLQVLRTSSMQQLRDELPPATGSGRTVLAVGGDGTVHAVVTVLDEAGCLPRTAVGILPCGTGNDLARTLKVPLDLDDAVEHIFTASPKPAELLVDDAGGVVVNAVHVGIGARAADLARRAKQSLGTPGYLVGAALAGVSSRGWQLCIEADGREIAKGRFLMVGIMLGRSIGGGTPLAPDADPDDGYADLVMTSATGPIARVGFSLALRKGRHLERDDTATLRVHQVRITGEPYPVNADGEVTSDVTDRTWTARYGSWSVLR